MRFAILTLLAACVPKQWVHATHDTAQAEKDRYECIKENSFVGTQVSAGAGGFSARRGLEYDREMMASCMRARGYRWERTESLEAREDLSPAVAWLTADAPASKGSVEASLAYGGTFGRDTTVGVSAGPDGGAIDGVLMNTDRRGQGWWTAAGAVEVSERASVAVRAGVRPFVERMDAACGGNDDALYLDCDPLILRRDALAPFGDVSMRVRAPFLDRLVFEGGVGAQVSSHLDARNVVIEGSTYDEDFEATVGVPEVPQAILPTLRIGVSFDPLHANPHGIRVGCAYDALLRSAELHREGSLPDDSYSYYGYSSQGVRSLTSCSVTYRFATLRKGENLDE